jgi:hypothetical protein
MWQRLYPILKLGLLGVSPACMSDDSTFYVDLVRLFGCARGPEENKLNKIALFDNFTNLSRRDSLRDVYKIQQVRLHDLGHFSYYAKFRIDRESSFAMFSYSLSLLGTSLWRLTQCSALYSIPCLKL